MLPENVVAAVPLLSPEHNAAFAPGSPAAHLTAVTAVLGLLRGKTVTLLGQNLLFPLFANPELA